MFPRKALRHARANTLCQSQGERVQKGLGVPGRGLIGLRRLQSFVLFLPEIGVEWWHEHDAGL